MITGKGEDNLLPITEYRHIMERRYLERLNRITNGNRKKACRISGLSRTRLFELLKKYDLSMPQGKHTPSNPATACDRQTLN
jgi:DNA-binding NtrC family response regulator